MSAIANLGAEAFVLGASATAMLDLWSALAAFLFKLPAPKYSLVGRWLGSMPRGQFFHASISQSAPIPGELAIGWIAHYIIGATYAFILLITWGQGWLLHPTLMPALVVGLGSVVAPFLIMQPGMGMGIAASRTANPTPSRLRSLLTHSIFAIALYLSGTTYEWVRHLS